MRVADYILKRLHSFDVDHVFGVFGAANGVLVDAFNDSPVKYVAMQHEQQAGFAAEGYAKARHSASFGVALATSGPGGQNFATPIANCYYDSVPVLFITGNVNTPFGKLPGSGLRQRGFQEDDPVERFFKICKFAMKVTKPEDIGWALTTAIAAMLSGRHGPALLDIPVDVQKAEIDEDKLELEVVRPPEMVRGAFLQAWADRVAKALSEAERPALVVGGGARRTRIAPFSRTLGIPVFPTWNALDLVGIDNPYYGGRIGTYGGAGFNAAIQRSDFVLFLGTRLSGRVTGGVPESFAPSARKFALDIDLSVCSEFPVPCDVFCGDTALGLTALIYAISKLKKPDWGAWLTHVKALRLKRDPVKPEYWSAPYAHPYVFARLLGQHLKGGDVVVGDCGGNIVTLNQAMEFPDGIRYFTNNGNSPMGFSPSGAVGAAVRGLANPHGGRTICVTGDGGLMLNLSILETIKHYGLPVKLFVINNGIYGITAQYQRTNFQRLLGCGEGTDPGYSTPDFAGIASAFGLRFLRMETVDSIRTTIEEALNSPGPVIAEVVCPGFSSYLPRIRGGACPIDDMET